ncbi:MAG: efflux RND transporter periplasmic adaptor subunit [Gammaproteobacteria bacterium]|nr:efflux RND transporter periplasmic adaptor subunit [Gammaproteobacteria bacterium]
MPKPTYKTLVLVILIGSVIGLFAYLTRTKPVVVTVTKVEIGSVESTVTNTRAGTVTACRRARLAPHIGGQISNLAVKEGQKVTKDEILVELWNRDVKAELLLAQNETKAAKAIAREACIRFETADREAARITKLFKQKLASEEQAEQAQGNAKAASAACDAAREKENVTLSRVEVVKATLERTIIRAPFDGVVAEVNGELGEFVTPSPMGIPTLPVVDLIDYQCIYVLAPIDEVDAPQVREGLPARIMLDAFPDHPFPATVQRISPYIQDVEKQARTVDVEVYFNHVIGDQNLLPGYSADAEIILAGKDNVLRIPTETIFEDNHVYALRQSGNTVEKRKITTGIGNWRYTEVLSGLAGGDTVITSIGIEGLRDGIEVQIAEETPR